MENQRKKDFLLHGKNAARNNKKLKFEAFSVVIHVTQGFIRVATRVGQVSY